MVGKKLMEDGNRSQTSGQNMNSFRMPGNSVPTDRRNNMRKRQQEHEEEMRQSSKNIIAKLEEQQRKGAMTNGGGGSEAKKVEANGKPSQRRLEMNSSLDQVAEQFERSLKLNPKVGGPRAQAPPALNLGGEKMELGKENMVGGDGMEQEQVGGGGIGKTEI